MQNTGDTADYRSISRGCRPCQAVADQVEGYFEAGGFVRTKGWSIKSVDLSASGPGGQITATVAVSSAPTEYRESADSDVKRLEGGSITELMTLTPRAASWHLINLEQLAQ
jgi:hypothetical protein